ncbi:hypothetical protein ACFQV4_14920 [Streptomyces thermocarboxydus]
MALAAGAGAGFGLTLLVSVPRELVLVGVLAGVLGAVLCVGAWWRRGLADWWEATGISGLGPCLARVDAALADALHRQWWAAEERTRLADGARTLAAVLRGAAVAADAGHPLSGPPSAPGAGTAGAGTAGTGTAGTDGWSDPGWDESSWPAGRPETAQAYAGEPYGTPASVPAPHAPAGSVPAPEHGEEQPPEPSWGTSTGPTTHRTRRLETAGASAPRDPGTAPGPCLRWTRPGCTGVRARAAPIWCRPWWRIWPTRRLPRCAAARTPPEPREALGPGQRTGDAGNRRVPGHRGGRGGPA